MKSRVFVSSRIRRGIVAIGRNRPIRGVEKQKNLGNPGTRARPRPRIAGTRTGEDWGSALLLLSADP